MRNQFLIAVASILAIKEDLRGSKSNLLSEVNVLERQMTALQRNRWQNITQQTTDMMWVVVIIRERSGGGTIHPRSINSSKRLL